MHPLNERTSSSMKDADLDTNQQSKSKNTATSNSSPPLIDHSRKAPIHNSLSAVRASLPVPSPAQKPDTYNDSPLEADHEDGYDPVLACRYALPREPTPGLVNLLRPSSEFCPVTLPGYETDLGNYQEGNLSDGATSTAAHTIRVTTDTERNENELQYTYRHPTEEHYMQSQSGRIWMDTLPAFLEAHRHQPAFSSYKNAYLHSENVIIQVDKRGVERVFEVFCSPRNLLAEGMTLECHGCLIGGWVIEEITGQDDQYVYMRCVNDTFREITEIRMVHRYQYRASWADKIRHLTHRMAPCFFVEWD
ncbi:hypothetical protein C8J57DRAFT_1490497 [Mycena rebaudengoi]|nr:hypothetical protein C8J57DRAFT_1490497 [Mycena rebaudengoi]